MVPRLEPIEILLVEDNPGDVRLTREGLQRGRLANSLHDVQDGEAAMAFLKRRPPYENAPRPDLILLDLNLPGLSGHEILEWLKADPDLKEIPVVVLTTSSELSDVKESYRLQASSVVTKPMDYETFLEAIHKLGLYWLALVRYPEPSPDGHPRGGPDPETPGGMA